MRFPWRRRDDDLDEEIRSHLQMATRDRVERGEDPEEAAAAARREFGNVGLVKEVTRETWGWVWLEQLAQDVRYGARTMLRHRALTVTAALTLALGVGASTAMFGVVNAVLLRPLPYEHADRLVMVEGNFLQLGMERIGASPPEFLDYRDQARSFDEIAAFRGVDFTLTDGTGPERVSGARVTPSLFSLLGAEPSLGRMLVAEDAEPGRGDVAVLSHGFWSRRFGSDPGLVGRSVALDGSPVTIVGVMPPGFQFPYPGRRWAARTDVWMPLSIAGEASADRSHYSLAVVARVAPGVTLEQAGAEMDAIGRRFADEYPSYHGPNGEDGGWRVTVVPLGEEVVGEVEPALYVLLGAVGLVLLIACANVANLLLVHAVGRTREIATRLALGVTRVRLARQFLTESFVLAALGGVAGLALSILGTDLLLALGPADIPRVAEIGVDARVLGFALAISVVTGVVFGTVPALRASRLDLNGVLKAGGRGTAGGLGHRRARDLFVVSEVALAAVLLVGAGLLVRSYVLLERVDPGFDPRNVLAIDVTLPPKYAEASQEAAFFRSVLERVEALPGVRSAGAATNLPLGGEGFGGPFSVEGRPFDPTKPSTVSYVRSSAGYFRTMGIPLRSGREFDERDGAGNAPVAVVNEAFVRNAFPDEDPLGKRIKLGGPNAPRPWLTIVGVVGDVSDRGLETASGLAMYVPYLQDATHSMTLVARTGSDPASLAAAVRREIEAVDAEQPVHNLRTMEQVVSDSVSRRRFAMLVLGLFAAVALALATVGVYGVMSYSVSRRTQEIGVRMALGAEARAVTRLVLRQGMRLALVGAGLGLLVSLGLTGLIASFLFGVSASDPLTFAAIALLLTSVALAACWVPARRAAKVDPMAALRRE